MRTYLVFLVLFFLFAAHTAGASDVILGTIKSINPEKGELIIDVMDTSAGFPAQEKEILVQINPGNTDLSGLRTGKLIRLWGNFVKDSPGIFEAGSLSQGGMHGRKSDPTGVRSRLGRGRGSFGRGMNSKGRGRH